MSLIRLQPCVTRLNLAAALYGSVGGLGMMTFMGVALPWVLLDGLAVDPGQTGRIIGLLATWHEIILLSVLALIGALADRRGRGFVFPLGFGLVGLTYLWFASVGSLPELVAARTFFSIGSCALTVMIGLVALDFPQEQDRGKWVGVTAVLQGVGVLISSFGLARLPLLLTSRGADAVTAQQQTLYVVVAFCLLSALLLGYGFRGFRPAAAPATTEPLLGSLRRGLALARTNRSILLAYAGSLISRADLVVVSTFFTLWVQQLARAQGKSPAEAVALAGMMFGAIQGVAMLWAPVWGVVMDRLDRIRALFIALALAGLGYCSLALVADPFSAAGWAACAFTGVGQISVLLSCVTLIGQETPVEQRGVVGGVSNAFGALGVLITASLGGLLYDLWFPTAPILVFGALNLVVLAWGLALRRAAVAGW
jgi:MFS family permease